MGLLVGIYIADGAGRQMRPVEEAEFVAGEGIVGDRYYAGTGKFSRAVQTPKYEVTLIDVDQVARFNSTYGLAFRPEDLRRNIVTRDIDLNALVGVEFALGEIVLRGVQLCEPCDYLAGLTHRDVVGGLVHRAGLRAGIVKGGVVNAREAVAIRRIAPAAARRPE